jgi:hypothetical protein
MALEIFNNSNAPAMAQVSAECRQALVDTCNLLYPAPGCPRSEDDLTAADCARLIRRAECLRAVYQDCNPLYPTPRCREREKACN